MTAALVVFAYLAIVLSIGIFGGRSGPSTKLGTGGAKSGGDAEQYFLAGRNLGPVIFLLSLFMLSQMIG